MQKPNSDSRPVESDLFRPDSGRDSETSGRSKPPLFQPNWGSMAVGLGVIAILWWFMKVKPEFIGVLAAITIVSNLLREPIASIIFGVGLILAAAFAYFRFNAGYTPHLLGLFGLYYAAMGIKPAIGRS
jgi:hypothetical protein